MSQGGSNTDTPKLAPRPLSLDELVALNDELAALVRAGLPLDQGLVALGQEMPGAVGTLASRLGARIQTGESLERMIEKDDVTFPPMWRAVVTAGLQSGRLASALESISTTARRVADTRRGIGLALVYPLAVAAFAFAEFVFLVVYLAPIMLDAYRSFAFSSEPLLERLVWLGNSAKWWGYVIPIVFFIGLAIWWHRLGQAARLNPSATRFPAMPTMRQALVNGRLATFAEILGLLVDNRVPLYDAVVLAAQTSGDARLKRDAFLVAERIRNGQRLTPQDARDLNFPPLLGWLISTGRYQNDLGRTLKQTADRYRRRAERASTFALVYLPIVLTLIVGTTLVLSQGVLLFGPIQRLLVELGRPG